jgi:hypothetical protein
VPFSAGKSWSDTLAGISQSGRKDPKTAQNRVAERRSGKPESDEVANSIDELSKFNSLTSGVALLRENPEITNMIARELTGIRSENSMKNAFLSLKERGMIEPVPGKLIGPKSAWRKTSKAAKVAKAAKTG